MDKENILDVSDEDRQRLNRDPVAKEAMTANWRTVCLVEKADTSTAASADDLA